MNCPTKKTANARGFTLVEILVVLVIATVVIAVAIPRIRSINEERNIRESARVVGSAFANASQRASVDGIAGVRITRNSSFSQAKIFGQETLQFAVTEVSLLRAVPSFTGDEQNAQITGSDELAGTVDVLEPLEQNTLGIIQNGDSISFNNSSVRYQINSVTGAGSGTLTLALDRGHGDYLPIPDFDAGAVGDNPNYVVHRLPRLLRSSTAELPQGYIIDLRFSGFEVLDSGLVPQLTTVFEPVLNLGTGVPPATNYDIDVIFDEEGTVDRVVYRDPISGNSFDARLPLGPIYLFVTEAPDSFEVSDEVATASETGLWVTVSNSTGSVNIGYNNSGPSMGFTYQTLSNYYNAAPDGDTIPSMDRDEFNFIINSSRFRSESTSANQ